jgi:hypothetical protein
MASVEFKTAETRDTQDNSEGVTGGSRALVPLLATLARRPPRPRAQPNPSFVTQLMATATLLQQPPAQALAAYRSVVDHGRPPANTGLRLRHSA